MEEIIYEMEYVIDGEKYLITAKKVEETNNETNEIETTMFCDGNCATCTENFFEEESTGETVNFEEVDYDDDDTIVEVSLSDKPEEIDIADWVNLIIEYGIIIKK